MQLILLLYTLIASSSDVLSMLSRSPKVGNKSATQFWEGPCWPSWGMVGGVLLIVEIMANYIVKTFGFLTRKKKKVNLGIVEIDLLL